ncbi:hypothetical protein SPI_09181 [Niveomyces insectorum RCEF 264]|uniref:Uncharacterized protein n=1 Tax=Niveomyces insectorum RCEF 264 TaxID=1081102 RepID=A0A167M604_9HYPO|nr:hypothetical protein SPI_09181 [Niveomyces insectorum RCEF 264]
MPQVVQPVRPPPEPAQALLAFAIQNVTSLETPLYGGHLKRAVDNAHILTSKDGIETRCSGNAGSDNKGEERMVNYSSASPSTIAAQAPVLEEDEDTNEDEDVVSPVLQLAVGRSDGKHGGGIQRREGNDDDAGAFATTTVAKKNEETSSKIVDREKARPDATITTKISGLQTRGTFNDGNKGKVPVVDATYTPQLISQPPQTTACKRETRRHSIASRLKRHVIARDEPGESSAASATIGIFPKSVLQQEKYPVAYPSRKVALGGEGITRSNVGGQLREQLDKVSAITAELNAEN